jgi:hypothetical protein
MYMQIDDKNIYEMGGQTEEGNEEENAEEDEEEETKPAEVTSL